MMIIKKFDEFEREKINNNDIDSLERELLARKTRRNNIKYEDLEINFKFIKEQILYELNNYNDYKISIGRRIEELEGSEKKLFHIEYESPRLGRIRIFKPKDNATDGFYEVNGDVYKTNVDDIRNFYHKLSQEIKNEPLIESLRDKMKPKTEKELDDAKDSLLEEISDYALDNYPEYFDDYLDTFEWFEVYLDKIVDYYEDGMSINEIVDTIVIEKW